MSIRPRYYIFGSFASDPRTREFVPASDYDAIRAMHDELLAALQQLLDEQEDAPLERRRTEWAEACARARRAIAQAEGRA